MSVAVLVGNEILRRGLESVLHTLVSVGRVRRCGTRSEADSVLGSEQFDVLIVSAFDRDWLAEPERPVQLARTKVLMLIDESTTDLAEFAAMPLDGFLAQQDLSADTLRGALDRCAAGELPMPAAMARTLLSMADAPAAQPRNRRINLTSREIEALALLVKGLSNKQIARRLAISSHGAKRLVASIMLKLDSPNRTTAVVNAIKAGLVDYQ